ncbi:MAG TPA: tetratricopeptide repeat protein [Streptosporangiaceae bacterium]|nr:tetratricopeptide repeat protein [Streptosporangiaceae bacterium]
MLGDYQQTISYCQEALALHLEYGNYQGAADTWDSLGYAYHHLGRHAEAIDCYEHALDTYRRADDLLSETTALDHLGDTRHALGNLREAREAWERAVSVLDDLRHPKADELRNKLRH